MISVLGGGYFFSKTPSKLKKIFIKGGCFDPKNTPERSQNFLRKTCGIRLLKNIFLLRGAEFHPIPLATLQKGNFMTCTITRGR